MILMRSKSPRDFRKLQSAMEYLTTYGWAILIIAVALGVLYQLGLFSLTNLSPKAPTGSCQVVRPNGIGTTSLMALQGLCANEPPQFVAKFGGAGSYVALKNSAYYKFTSSNNKFSMVAWFKTSYTTSTMDIVSRGACTSPAGPGYKLELVSGNAKFFMANTGGTVVGSVLSPQKYSDGRWHLIIGINNGTDILLYVDQAFIGNAIISPAPASILPNSNYTIGYSFSSGSTGCDSEYFNGSISNVQIYNTSLNANSVKALYIQGIGTPPVNLQRLVGWWPLNGDTNDYSGNGNNAVSSGIGFWGS
jgi:hypothetical protein